MKIKKNDIELLDEKGTDVLNRMDNVNNGLEIAYKVLSETQEMVSGFAKRFNGMREENIKLINLAKQQHSLVLEIITIYGEEELKEKLKAHRTKESER